MKTPLLLATLLIAACEVRGLDVRVTDASLPDAEITDAFGVPDVPVGGSGGSVILGDGSISGAPGDASLPEGDAMACSPNLQTDPANCGTCGTVCSFANGLPQCNAGQCGLMQCLPGFVNLNNLEPDGCEYRCTVSNNGAEACDSLDNDCDGATDEENDFKNDAKNCGGCRIECAFLNAGASCAEGQCVLGTCQPGFKNSNGIAADGCECAESNGGIEICDGFDNDCNGMVDDVPDIENSSDPQHCGACAANCTALPHAAGLCEMGGCKIAGCETGFADIDKNPLNGCELACPGGFEGAQEVCDNIDNDCDGKTDAEDPDMKGTDNFCRDKGECAGAMPVCVQGGWRCDYKDTVEVTGPNQVIGNETRCDGKDNDCDGCIDESFPQVGLKPAAVGGSCAETPPIACADDKKGQCQGRGHFVCNAAGNGITCTVDTPGQQPAAELCDNLDNNCDGIVDNAAADDPARVKDAMVAVSGGPLASTIYVDAYEASRPDADGDSIGVSNRRACSKAGALPWVNVNHATAAAACAAAGKRLCSEAEWQRACQTAAMTACSWSFGLACSTADINVCNVYERDADMNMAGNQNQTLATGALTGCYADWGPEQKIFDMTGNVREWTAARAAGMNPLRGGSFDTVLDGSRCDFAFITVDDTFQFNNTGFRCCRDTAP